MHLSEPLLERLRQATRLGPRQSFDERRDLDPQGVIDDLLRQITAQARVIHGQNVRLGLPDYDGVSDTGLEALAETARPRSKLDQCQGRSGKVRTDT
jgi:hypothetical protein